MNVKFLPNEMTNMAKLVDIFSSTMLMLVALKQDSVFCRTRPRVVYFDCQW